MTEKPPAGIFRVIDQTETIHGFKYIAKVSLPTRIFWIFSFFLSICGFLFYANQVYIKWYLEPDIGLKIVGAPAMSIPFPAITICPLTKVRQNFLNFTEAYLQASSGNFTLSHEERRHFEMAIQLCLPEFVEEIYDQTFHKNASLEGAEIIKYMKMQFEGIDIVGQNEWVDKMRLHPVLTSDGFCMSLNILDYNELFNEDILSEDFDIFWHNKKSSWDETRGYFTNDLNTFPRRLLAGYKESPSLLLIHRKFDEDPICRMSSFGFLAYIHMPHEIPGKWHQSFLVKKETSLVINMEARSFGIDSDLLKYGIEQRKCIRSEENHLKFFKSYTQSNCELECWTNFTLKTCGCVSFFMPRDKLTAVCNITRLKCVHDAEDEWSKFDKGMVDGNCTGRCYKACNYIEYDQLIPTEDDFDANRTLDAFNILEGFYMKYPGGQPTFINIMFRDFIIKHHENFLSYKIQHFVADSGGLLGLFMGGSILSLVEITFNFFSVVLSRKASKNPDILNKDLIEVNVVKIE